MRLSLHTGRTAEFLQLAVLLVLLCVFYFVIIPVGIEDPVDMGFDQGLPPSFTARAVAWVAGLIMIGRIVQLVWRTDTENGNGELAESASSAPAEESIEAVELTGRVVIGILAALVFAFVLIPLLGFVPASLILLALLLAMLGERNRVRLLVLPLIVTAGVWLLFAKVLGVALPTGTLLVGLMAS